MADPDAAGSRLRWRQARLPSASHIDRLRQKIERDPRRPVLLLTLNGGYRFGLALA
jgi:hypothetical protein